MIERLTLRQDYFDDPAALQALADLLHDVFGIDITLQNRLGGPDPSSMPFGYFDEAGRCVANLSAFSMPLVIEGRVVRAAGFQSGAVRPEFRGRVSTATSCTAPLTGPTHRGSRSAFF